MADTLATIREHLRFRLGEITAGTWTDDELNTQIYNAERKVCEDAIITTTALLTDVVSTPIVANQYRYILPADFIRELNVFQIYSNMHYKLSKSNIALMLDRFSPTSTADRLTKYCVHGVAPAVLTAGVATGGSATTLENADVDFTAMGITANVDYVENITDDSRALITAVSANTLTFSGGLSGGSRNSFRLGDEYQVVTGEANYRVLYVYPVPTGTNEETKKSYTSTGDSSIVIGRKEGTEYKAAMAFETDEDVVVSGVEIYISGKTGSPIGPINIRIETSVNDRPSGTLVNPNASASITSPSEGGWNEARFINPFRITGNETYFIVAQMIEQTYDSDFPISLPYGFGTSHYYSWSVDTAGSYGDGWVCTKEGSSDWQIVSSSDALFKINGLESEENLIIHYARYPRQMASDTDESEIPQYAREAVYLWAMYLAFCKHPGAMSNEAQQARALYEVEIEKVKDRLRDEIDGHVDRVADVMWFDAEDEELYKGVPLSISLPLGKA